MNVRVNAYVFTSAVLQHSTLNTNTPLLLINDEVIETACMIILWELEKGLLIACHAAVAAWKATYSY